MIKSSISRNVDKDFSIGEIMARARIHKLRFVNEQYSIPTNPANPINDFEMTIYQFFYSNFNKV